MIKGSSTLSAVSHRDPRLNEFLGHFDGLGSEQRADLGSQFRVAPRDKLSAMTTYIALLRAVNVGVTGKLCLWLSLGAAYGQDSRLQGVDLTELARRARDQRQRLERVRRKAAVEALT